MSAKRVGELFLSKNLTVEDIKSAYSGRWTDINYNFIKDVWDFRLTMLSVKQEKWMESILETILKSRKPKVIQIGKYRSKIETPEKKLQAKKDNQKSDKWFKENVKVVEIDPITRKERVINDPNTPLNEAYMEGKKV